MEMLPDPGTSPAALTGDTVRAWMLDLAEVERRIGAQFSRWDIRRRAGAYLRGLLSPGERKNGWQLVAVNDEETLYGVQHLLGRARWDAEAVRDALRSSVMEHLGAPRGVLVIDETGFLKKGRHSAGVARHYSGTAGRVDNCQLGVFLAYASALGHALLDRALSLPKEWTQDRARCACAGMPAARPYAGVVRLETMAPGRGAILSLQTACSSINYNCSSRPEARPPEPMGAIAYGTSWVEPSRNQGGTRRCHQGSKAKQAFMQKPDIRMHLSLFLSRSTMP